MKQFRDIGLITRSFSIHWRLQTTDPLIKYSIATALACVVASIGLLLWKWSVIPVSVPLWYSRPWGEDQLASPFWLLALPSGILVWLLIALIMSGKIQRDSLFIKIFFAAVTIGSLLSVFTLIRIIFLIT